MHRETNPSLRGVWEPIFSALREGLPEFLKATARSNSLKPGYMILDELQAESFYLRTQNVSTECHFKILFILFEKMKVLFFHLLALCLMYQKSKLLRLVILEGRKISLGD